MRATCGLGFTGAYWDSVTCAAPLGNGYRWYLPSLMRFNAPDSHSPFAAGGINLYGYCVGDPVNRVDPTGHFPRLIRALAVDAAEDTVIGKIDAWMSAQHRAGFTDTVVVSGYSGKEYAEPEAFAEHLQKIVDRHPKAKFVAGATKPGIGLIYDIAAKNGRPTLGIVSSEARSFPDDISPHCGRVIFVDDPEGTWKVLSRSGESYMLAPLEEGGSFYAFGGGDVTVSETIEALQKGYVPIQSWRKHLFADYAPNPRKIAETLDRLSFRERREFDPMPLRTFVGDGLFRMGPTPGQTVVAQYF